MPRFALMLGALLLTVAAVLLILAPSLRGRPFGRHGSQPATIGSTTRSSIQVTK